MTYIGRLNVFVMFLVHYQGVLLGISGQFLVLTLRAAERKQILVVTMLLMYSMTTARASKRVQAQYIFDVSVDTATHSY